ncbi:MAG: hypothetical protein ABW012_05075 [Gaiellaceae bacterium]
MVATTMDYPACALANVWVSLDRGRGTTTSASDRKGLSMYIGGGVITLIVIILLLVWLF